MKNQRIVRDIVPPRPPFPPHEPPVDQSAAGEEAPARTPRNRASKAPGPTLEHDDTTINESQCNWIGVVFHYRFKVNPGTKWNDVQQTVHHNLSNSADSKNVVKCIEFFKDFVHHHRKKDYPKKGQGLPRQGTEKAALVIDIIRKGK